jgi:hypothetical protein
MGFLRTRLKETHHACIVPARSGTVRSREKSSLGHSTAGNMTSRMESFCRTRPLVSIAIPQKSKVRTYLSTWILLGNLAVFLVNHRQ